MKDEHEPYKAILIHKMEIYFWKCDFMILKWKTEVLGTELQEIIIQHTSSRTFFNDILLIQKQRQNDDEKISLEFKLIIFEFFPAKWPCPEDSP